MCLCPLPLSDATDQFFVLRAGQSESIIVRWRRAVGNRCSLPVIVSASSQGMIDRLFWALYGAELWIEKWCCHASVSFLKETDWPVVFLCIVLHHWYWYGAMTTTTEKVNKFRILSKWRWDREIKMSVSWLTISEEEPWHYNTRHLFRTVNPRKWGLYSFQNSKRPPFCTDCFLCEQWTFPAIAFL